MPNVASPAKFSAVTSSGGPGVGYLLYTYQAGTLTPAVTYTDSTVSVPNANPVVMNARGEADVWLPTGSLFKFKLTDNLGNLIWTVDFIKGT